MAQHVVFVMGDGTARITPDALRVRLEQSRFIVRSQRSEGDEVELEIDGGMVMWLFIEDGYVVEIEGEITFANDRKSNMLLELIESMGWVPAEV